MPLYHSSTVKVKIGSATYEVSQKLLCRDSQYFRAAFNGAFKEGEEQSIVLKEIEGVVSSRSFELFLQWLYLGHIILGEENLEDKISAIVEFARFADMLGVTNLESELAEYIKTAVLSHSQMDWTSTADFNVRHINYQHIYGATRLPVGHKLRLIFAQAAIESFVNSNIFKFHDDVQNIPEFAADILRELRPTLATFIHTKRSIEFTDPLSGKTKALHRFQKD